MKLYFNPQTKQQIEAVAANLPHALLLTGVKGAGLQTTALHIAADTLAGLLFPADKNGDPDEQRGTISVARIRELYDESKGKSLTARVFVIDNADRMSHGAQNAFLKLLEEPPANTHFILTSHNESALLPTIHSRVERVHIMPLGAEQSRDMAHTLKFPGAQLSQALFVADGRPAELARLAASKQYFADTSAAMTAAKTFLSGNKTDAVQTAYAYAASRSAALQLLDSAKIILLATAKTRPTPEIIAQLDKLSQAYDAIAANGNTKLQLMAIMV